MVTLGILGFAAAAISVSVSSSANVSLQAASWQEALMAAEAGADTAMASFRVALDEPQYWTTTSPANALTDTQTGATAWPSASPPAGISTSDGKGWTTVTSAQKLSLLPLFRATTGGATGMQAAVTIEAPPTWTTTDSTGVVKQWYRVRSTGVSGISGPARVGMDKRDSDLRKISLVNARSTLSGYLTPGSVGPAQVTRSVELIIAPLASGLWDRAITATSPTGGGSVNLGAGFTIDSYDSSDSTKSTGGLYDATKRQSNAVLASDANGQYVNIGGAHLYGNVLTNGGTAKSTQNVTGTVSNAFFEAAPDISTPSWANTNTNVQITNTTPPVQLTLTGGSASLPQNYSYSSITLKNQTLTCAPGANGGYINIYVDSNFNMTNAAQWVVQSGVHVSVYINGLLSVDGTSTVANQSNNAANLSLYGIAPKAGTNPQWSYNGVSDFSGTIYAPEVKLKITGSANFFGAVLVAIYDTGGTSAAGFHFDEALLKGGGSSPRYQMASWIEDVR
jgi:hypothetical protein